MLRRILSAAALAGLTAGLLLTAVQHFAIAPLLRAAEVYEYAAIAASPPVQAHGGTAPAAPAWSPREIWSRTLATALANIVLATGFALLLAAAMTLRRATGARAGVLFGAAGFLVFFVAPSIGLPPELPGTVAAPLHDREVWWVATVAATAIGLWLIAFGARPPYRIAGVIVLCAPHLVGAPPAPEEASAVPAALASQFLYATYGVNLALWLVLGGLVGTMLRKQGSR